jgi:hypothetical protein
MSRGVKREIKPNAPEPLMSQAECLSFSCRILNDIYCIIIAGEALASVYHEPRFVASRRSDPEIARMTVKDSYFQLPRNQLAFFEKFAISSMETTLEEEGTVFGPLGKWLLESILSDRESMGRHGRSL